MGIRERLCGEMSPPSRRLGSPTCPSMKLCPIYYGFKLLGKFTNMLFLLGPIPSTNIQICELKRGASSRGITKPLCVVYLSFLLEHPIWRCIVCWFMAACGRYCSHSVHCRVHPCNSFFPFVFGDLSPYTISYPRLSLKLT